MKIYWLLLLSCSTILAQAQNKYSDSLKTLLAGTHKPVEEFNLLNRLLEFSYISGESNPDSSYCIRLLDIAQELDNDSMLAIAYNQVGNNFFRNNNDLSHALEYFFKGIPFAQKVADRRRMSSLYIDIAAIYHELRDKREEIKYIRKAFNWLPDKSAPLYPFMLAQSQYHISRYFLSLKQNDSALYYAQALTVTNLQLKSPLFQASSQALLGEAYDNIGDTVLAAIHANRANTMNDSVQYLWGKIEGKQIYIAHLLRNNKLAEAKKQALELGSMDLQKNRYEVQRIAAGFLTALYDKAARPDSAFYYSRLESSLKDSIFSRENLNRIQSLAFNERIRLMEEEDRLADEAEHRKLNIQYALIALGIVSLIVLFFVLSHTIIVTEKWISYFVILGLLIVFEFINLLIHPFLEKLMHHTPVLMLLALVVIASLLIPLHHHLEKYIKVKMTEKNKKIRLAAARKTIEKLSTD